MSIRIKNSELTVESVEESPGQFVLEFKARGATDVDVYYTIENPAHTVRFKDYDGIYKREIKRSAKIHPSVFDDPVKHTEQIGRPDLNKDPETFQIKVYVVEEEKPKNDPNGASTSCLCQYAPVENPTDENAGGDA